MDAHKIMEVFRAQYAAAADNCGTGDGGFQKGNSCAGGGERGARSIWHGKQFRTAPRRARLNLDQMRDLLGDRGYEVGPPRFDLSDKTTYYAVQRGTEQPIRATAKQIKKFLSTEEHDITAFDREGRVRKNSRAAALYRRVKDAVARYRARQSNEQFIERVAHYLRAGRNRVNLQIAISRAVSRYAEKFDESKHPRDDDGKFTSGGSGGGARQRTLFPESNQNSQKSAPVSVDSPSIDDTMDTDAGKRDPQNAPQTGRQEMKTTDMSREELIRAAKRHDAVINEGGEGYNPYRAELERREMAAPQLAPSLQEQISSLTHDVNLVDFGAVQRGEAAAVEKFNRLNAEIARLKAEDDAEFLAEWTIDVTRERRAAWNARVRSGEFGNPIDPKKLNAAVLSQGWYVDDLKRAVTLHNLQKEQV